MSVRKFEGSNHAQLYAKFRPTYPNDVIQKILDFLKDKIPEQEWHKAVDCGCGTGQGTNRLAKYFKTCYGFDISAAQIKEANESPHSDNVFYDVSPGESVPTIPSKSVQLVTAFAAAHWFDINQFFKETDRILVDNGVVALVCYLMPGPDPIDPDSPDDKRMIELMKKVWFDKRLEQFKSSNIGLAERQYKDFKFPDNYEYVHKGGLTDTKTICAEDLIGFYESWSLYQGLVAKDKQLSDKCLQEFTDKLKAILKTNDLSSKQIIIKYNYFIAMGRKRQ